MAEVIQGLDAVLKKLEALDDTQARNALKAGLRKGAGEVRKTARANAKKLDNPETSEAIYRNVKVKMWKNPKGKKYLGISTGINRNASDNDTFYWRFLEFGTSRIKARPFLEPALKESKDKAFEAMKEGALNMINKITNQ